MAPPTADKVFWSFLWYLKHNPFKALGGMGEDDLDNMAALFAAENSDALSAADPGGTYTDVEWPGTITAVQDTASIDQADFPEYEAGAR